MTRRDHRAARIAIAAVNGVSESIAAWSSLTVGPRATLRRRLLISSVGALCTLARLIGLRRAAAWPPKPAATLRERVSLLFQALQYVYLTALALLLWRRPAAERQEELRAWQGQRRRYRQAAKQWKRGDRNPAALWRTLSSRKSSPLPPQARPLVLILAAISSIGQATHAWWWLTTDIESLPKVRVVRRLMPLAATLQLPVTFLTARGVFPSHLWILRSVRRAALFLFLPCVMLAWLIYTAAVLGSVWTALRERRAEA
jgi:hypothetical protein